MIEIRISSFGLLRNFVLGTFVVALSAFWFHMQAQDLIYSQFYNAPLQLNPAFAGGSNGALLAANARNQWPGINQSFRSYSISYDQYFEGINSGLGLYLQSDNAGDGILRTVSASAVYSYQTFITRDLRIKFGLEGRYAQSRLDWDQLIFGEQIDVPSGSVPGSLFIPNTEVRPDRLSKGVFDVSAGMLLYSEDYYAGLTIRHMNGPNLSFYNANGATQLPLLVSLHLGTQINFVSGNKAKSRAFLSPNLLIVRQSELMQINVGSLIGYDRVFGGLWYRHSFSIPDAVIFSVGFRQDNFKIAYSYDFTVSELNIGNSLGSHELGVIMIIGAEDQGSRYNDCLSIFR